MTVGVMKSGGTLEVLLLKLPLVLHYALPLKNNDEITEKDV